MRALLLSVLLVLGTPALAQDTPESLRAEVLEGDRLYGAGRYEEALAFAEALQPRLEAVFGTFSVEALQNRAAITGVRADLGESPVEAYAAILDDWVEHHGRDHPEAQRARMNLAMGLSNSGQPGQAMDYALEAYEFAQGHWGPEAVTTLFFRYNVAGLMERTGQREAALSEFVAVKDALAAHETDRARKHRAVVTYHAARMAEALGRNDEAVMLYAESVPATREAFGERHPDLVSINYRLGRLAGRMGYIDVAGQVLLDGAKLAEELYGPKSRQVSEINAMIALVLTREGPGSEFYELGVGFLDTVIVNMEEVLGRTHPSLSEPLTWAATFAVEQGNWERALELAHWSAEIGTSMSGPWFDALAAAEAAGAMSPVEAAEEAFEAAQASYFSVASTSTRLLGQRLELAREGVGDAARGYTDAIRRRNELQGALLTLSGLPLEERIPGEMEALQAELDATLAQMEALDGELAGRDRWLNGLKEGETASAAEVRAGLKPGEAVVIVDISSKSWGQSRIVVVTPDSAAWAPIPAEQPQIAALVERVREGIELKIGVRAALSLKAETGEAPRDFDLEAAAELYALTFGLVEEALAGADHLYVELRGAASALPPQLLLRRVPEGGLGQADWLVRHHAVTVIPSVMSLRIAALGEEIGRAPEPFLGVANPDYGVEAPASNARAAALRSGLAPLPETAGEVRAVAGAVQAGAGAVLEQAAASEAALKGASLDRFRVLYFATHGLVAGDAVGGAVLDEPALALTPGAPEDGFLTASEIARLKLNADWVVLSACNTAVGGEPGGEALSGLAQAFFYAGARALLVSHWPVESQSAVALMTDIFARRAADPGLSAAEAQRQAMLALMETDRWSHPAYWAPFILVGDPG